MYYAAMMQNKTLADVYHPELNYVEATMFYFSLPISILILIYTIYVISSKSTPSMRSYKHLLITELVSSYLFEAVYFFWRPVLLWPMLAAVPTGPLGNASPYTFFIMFICFLFAEIAIICAQLIQFAYRLAMTYPPGSFFRDFICGKVSNLYFLNVFMVVSVCALFMPPAIISISDPFEAQQKFIEDFPSLQILTYQYPYLSGYHPDLPNVCIKPLVDFGLIVSILFPFATVLAMFVFIRRMKSLKMTQSKKTYDMHFMLLKALLAQYTCCFFLIVIPLFIFCIFAKLEVTWGSYFSTTAVMVITFHGMVNCSCILWFILPYRTYTVQLFNVVKHCISLKPRTVMISPSVALVYHSSLGSH